MEQAKSNPEINPNYKVNSKPVKDDYTQIRELIEKKKQEQSSKYEHVPDNPIDTAHLLLSNSDTSELMLEMDKEIKLANLDKNEQYIVYQFTSVWNDLRFLKEKQEKKLQEAKVKYGNLHDIDGDDSIIDEIDDMIEKKEPSFFDAAGSYKKARFTATLSRGKYGFERTQQVKTISEYKMEQNDITDKSPSFMQRFAGGFKK